MRVTKGTVTTSISFAPDVHARIVETAEERGQSIAAIVDWMGRKAFGLPKRGNPYKRPTAEPTRK